jgi:isopentenyl-diphosphate delta-isomerase type 1
MTATESITPEYVILVDEHDRETGYAEKLSAHQQNLLHRAFSVFILRECGQLELLLQQRASGKYHSPGLWTNTCCSHPRPGESVTSAANRRLREELGVVASLKQVGRFQYNAHFPNGLSENEIDHVLVGTIPAQTPIIPDFEEVQAYRWVSITALQQELAQFPQHFTPWLSKALGFL